MVIIDPEDYSIRDSESDGGVEYLIMYINHYHGLCLVYDPEDKNIMRGTHRTGLEAGQQPDQGEKETGAASDIQAGAGQPHLVRDCKGEGGIQLGQNQWR